MTRATTIISRNARALRVSTVSAKPLAPRRSRSPHAVGTRAPRVSSPAVLRFCCNAGARARSLPRRGRPGARPSPVCHSSSSSWPQPMPQVARRQYHRWYAAGAREDREGISRTAHPPSPSRLSAVLLRRSSLPLGSPMDAKGITREGAVL